MRLINDGCAEEFQSDADLQGGRSVAQMRAVSRKFERALKNAAWFAHWERRTIAPNPTGRDETG